MKWFYLVCLCLAFSACQPKKEPPKVVTVELPAHFCENNELFELAFSLDTVASGPWAKVLAEGIPNKWYLIPQTEDSSLYFHYLGSIQGQDKLHFIHSIASQSTQLGSSSLSVFNSQHQLIGRYLLGPYPKHSFSLLGNQLIFSAPSLGIKRKSISFQQACPDYLLLDQPIPLE